MQKEPVPQCGKRAKKPNAAAGSALLLPHFGVWVLQWTFSPSVPHGPGSVTVLVA